jgi:hypothetical protein
MELMASAAASTPANPVSQRPYIPVPSPLVPQTPLRHSAPHDIPLPPSQGNTPLRFSAPAAEAAPSIRSRSPIPPPVKLQPPDKPGLIKLKISPQLNARLNSEMTQPVGSGVNIYPTQGNSTSALPVPEDQRMAYREGSAGTTSTEGDYLSAGSTLDDTLVVAPEDRAQREGTAGTSGGEEPLMPGRFGR